MKKYLVSLSFLLLGLVALVRAGTISAPLDTAGNPIQFSDYGGVSYATSAFPNSGTGVSVTTAVALGSGVFHGVVFSSGNGGAYDFVDVFDATCTVAIGTAFSRWYNVNGATSTTNTNGATSGFVGPKYPIRFNRGLYFKPGVATYNMIDVLYNKD